MSILRSTKSTMDNNRFVVRFYMFFALLIWVGAQTHAQIDPNITATAGPNGTISPSGVVSVPSGSNQAFTITPSTGYHVDSVLVDGVRVDSTTSYTFENVTTDHTISASFAINVYTITASAGANGTIAPLGVTNINHGGSQSYTITPSTGYHVADVLVDGVSVGPVTNYNFTNVTANHTISVTFAINSYTITASTGANGTVAPPGVTNVNHGGNQSYTITPDVGYHVADVLVDGISVGPLTNYTFTNITASHTISASFAINAYTITATSGANGTIAPPGVTNVNHGGNQSYTITPDAGYHVAAVVVDGVSVGPVTSYNFTNVTTNHTISVTFTINIYTITASAGVNGTIAPPGVTSVSHGGSQNYTIAPSTGYHVADVLIDGLSVGPVTSYNFTNVTANHTISATFAINIYTITASVGGSGTISPPGVTNVNYGASQSYTIAPSAGNHVVDVLINGVSVGPVTSYSFTNVTANHTISATFAINIYTLTANAGANGTITPAGVTNVSHGGNQSYTMTSFTGYHVADVLVDGISVGAVTTYDFTNVTASHTISVAFTINTYTITPFAGPNGSINPGGPATVTHGSNQTFTITPSSGHRIDSLFIDGAMIDTTRSYTFVNVTANHTIRASFVANPVTILVILNLGWNLISNPVTNPVPGDSVKQLFPTSLNAYAFEFIGTYVHSYTLVNGKGYWEKFRASTFNAVRGGMRTYDSVTVAAGWNIVGSISYTVDTSTIVSVPPGLRASKWFGYSNGYTTATHLIPGKGYLVRSSGAGKFYLGNPASGSSAAKSQATEASEVDALNTLTITDANGGSQTLYFGADAQNAIPVEMFAMPPVPPQGGFDARFETADGGSMVRTHDVQVTNPTEFAVSVQSDAYPLTITWNINKSTASYALTDGLGNRAFHAKDMRGEGSMTIANSSVNRFSVKLLGDGQLPKEFTLSQNYPNPFNPTTNIEYQLPVESRVSVTLFNMLGQEVATLVNEDQKAGYRSVQWNANGFASGVYVYRIQAGNFVASKKLVLLK